jgi:hypothetical protein
MNNDNRIGSQAAPYVSDANAVEKGTAAPHRPDITKRKAVSLLTETPKRRMFGTGLLPDVLRSTHWGSSG